MTHCEPAPARLLSGVARPALCPIPATRPWAPLADAAWAALAPLLPRSRLPDLRHRLNCILAVAAHGVAWVPAGAQGPFWPTLYRHYHRWARAGVWARLHAAAAEAADPALRALTGWLAALHRRAVRIRTASLQALNSSNPEPAARPVPAAPASPPDPAASASIALSRFRSSIPSSPKPPTGGVQRPPGPRRGVRKGRRAVDPPAGPVATCRAHRQFAATGKGNGQHDATA
ncbi:transposase [Dankookia rubra]|uniref:transposase n=1 Tax=Dankookia rubra TaxID=1442381 RepID=UPI00140B7A83